MFIAFIKLLILVLTLPLFVKLNIISAQLGSIELINGETAWALLYVAQSAASLVLVALYAEDVIEDIRYGIKAFRRRRQ